MGLQITVNGRKLIVENGTTPVIATMLARLASAYIVGVSKTKISNAYRHYMTPVLVKIPVVGNGTLHDALMDICVMEGEMIMGGAVETNLGEIRGFLIKPGIELEELIEGDYSEEDVHKFVDTFGEVRV